MTDIHKEKCKKLKEIRKSIANKLKIDLHQTECTFKGKCSGTCPKCKQEEEILNKAIFQKTAIVGIAATMSASLVGCTITQETPNLLLEELQLIEPSNIEKELSGDVEYIPENDKDDINNRDYVELEGMPTELEDIPTDIPEKIETQLEGDVVPIEDE